MLHQLFIDFTQAYDSKKQNAVIDVMKKEGISKKLQDLVTMTLQQLKEK
jgi:purine nucleoside phosphorylase